MRIILEGSQIVEVEEFSTDEIKELNKIGKDVYVADGCLMVEDRKNEG